MQLITLLFLLAGLLAAQDAAERAQARRADAETRAKARQAETKAQTEERRQEAADRAAARRADTAARAEARRRDTYARAEARRMYGYGGYTPSQAGSVKIAESAAPTDILTAGAVSCLEDAGKVLSADKAANYCLQVAKIEAERGKKVANEAADATKSSRPIIIGRYSYRRHW